MIGGWVYIMANRAYGVLYIGVTSSLPHRAMQHRDGTGSEFCRRYRLYAERHETIMDAIAREKAMKAWKRDWKVNLIESINPKWVDLFDTLHLE